ncbi:DUF1690-domain-containing protein [Suhomyces tanzawaensis NRRL Y-17324]|uniref:DUF1690-domain-containing protein n=1 Tax=Suhomyces tanzawaensis NRRL Y-17324 TaxID=984487 RepID=A0A1E4SLW7_9ASCO|nr:DUF1690-domain-containing protein [Suhomyces tanzawaensis NRRL Y-17324]ODV80397.1 DUF1690-domain-containing protein [Suhomyces tanzawaensis NRRL Y-17324]
MGSATSKPETKVFTPSTPVDFSASFLSQLEGSAESDYSRAQHTEKYIQERVAAELSKLEQETIKRFQTTTSDSLLKDKADDVPIPSTNDKITKLTALLQENIKLAKVEVSDDIKSAREEVLKCLKENQGKTLNCWDEVEKFRKSVREL